VLFINVPIAVMVLIGTGVLVPGDTGRGTLDVPGAITATLGVGSLIFALTRGNTNGWNDDAAPRRGPARHVLPAHAVHAGGAGLLGGAHGLGLPAVRGRRRCGLRRAGGRGIPQAGAMHGDVGRDAGQGRVRGQRRQPPSVPQPDRDLPGGGLPLADDRLVRDQP
jgi:hypothetical protein